MTNKQAMELIGKPITVRQRINGKIYRIKLLAHWTGTIFFIEAQTTNKQPLFNIYPVELVDEKERGGENDNHNAQ